VTPLRGRIERDGNGGFVSTFPHRIDVMFLRNDDGGWVVAEGITTGVAFKAVSIALDEATRRIETEARDIFTPRLREILDRVKTRDDHFIAITDDAPAIETHPGVRWTDTRTVITGPLARDLGT